MKKNSKKMNGFLKSVTWNQCDADKVSASGMVALVALFMVIYCISQKHSKHDRLRSRRAALKGLVHKVEKTEFNTQKKYIHVLSKMQPATTTTAQQAS